LFDAKAFFELINPNKNIVVAYSGGGDSSALLHFCHELKQQGLFSGKLSAIHVNHALSKNADSWEKHCQKFCIERDIALHCKSIEVNSKNSGLESAARQGRFKVFKEMLESDDQLLLAHHADDVAETILFRLFRGTGLDGLQGPVRERQLGNGIMIRPWLDYPKSYLNDYLLANNIQFITDESNFADDQDRNFIRNELLSLASTRWPKASTQIQQTSMLVSKHKKVHDLLIDKQFGSAISGITIQRDLLMNLDADTCGEVIRYWIKQNNVAMPNKKILNEILKAFINSQPSSKTQVHWSRADNDQKRVFLSFYDGDLVINKK
jgi:tRNA(Ile)-lysidine synthase